MTRNFRVSALLAAGLMAASLPAQAGDGKTTEIAIKNHLFSPDRIEIAAGKRHTLIIKNMDRTPEEFESHDLRIEKIVRGNGTIKVKLPPLKAGTYRFVGEFHEATAKGVIIVTAGK